jgi:adenylylsulfate kinase
MRSVAKAVSWRIFATSTTILIVFIFFGRLDLAIAAGIFESISKIAIYFVHERIWQKIKLGKKKIDPFVIWFTGVPLSGKTTLADAVYDKLSKLAIPIERIDSKDIRDLIPEIGFERNDRIRHLKRVQHLVRTLQNNSISVVCSFVSPYEEARSGTRNGTINYVEVYVKASYDSLRSRDINGLYQQAETGTLRNFTGVSDIYEEPVSPEIVIDTDSTTPEAAAEIIARYIRKNVLKGVTGI